MRQICAWCKCELNASSPEMQNQNEPISHGICGDCTRNLLSDKAQPLKKFLDQFSPPVLLVDHQARVLASNNSGLTMLGKEHHEIENQLGGDVFDCRNADLPGGCGKSIHCKACTIRNTILETLKTGQSQQQVPAYPDLHSITKEDKVRFLITTEKVGQAVLLRIDKVG
jgi:transcriptional regulator with PAS, ATPase and Fis domain